MTNIIVKPLNENYTQKVIEVFGAAFEKDPLMSYFFGSEYPNLSKYLWQYVCDLTPILDLILLGAFVEGELKGAAFVTPPEVDKRGKQEAIDRLDEQLFSAVGEAVIMRLEAYSRIKEANKPKKPHFYLNTLGVLPKSQGQGVGKALMAKLDQLLETNSQASGVALDTENESNLNFYQKLGYSITTITDLDRVKIWSLFRQG